MKKILSIFFAAVMILSVVFIGDALSSNNSMSAQAQTKRRQVTVRRKKRGIASRTYRGGKYIYRKAKNGTVYVYRKTAKGTVYVGKKPIEEQNTSAEKPSTEPRKFFVKRKK